jgi:hypothetical protein
MCYVGRDVLGTQKVMGPKDMCWCVCTTKQWWLGITFLDAHDVKDSRKPLICSFASVVLNWFLAFLHQEQYDNTGGPRCSHSEEKLLLHV